MNEEENTGLSVKDALEQNTRLMRGLFRMQEEEVKLRQKEQRWNQVRFAIFVIPSAIAIIIWLIGFGVRAAQNWSGDYVAMVDLRGTIAEGGPISSRRAIAGLNGAFSDDNAKGVLIRISSPGGGATQSALIRDYIDAKKKETGKRVVVVGEDVMASGAYLIASGADTIYVHKTTLTGSIGVIMEGWGFQHVMDKIGVERRVFTAGEFKQRLSPYQPVTEADREKAKDMVAKTHKTFIAYVELGRGDRIKGDRNKLFNGDVFSGEEALQFGLVDKLGSVRDAMKSEFDTDKARDFSFKDPWYVQASQQSVRAALDWVSGPRLELQY